MNIDDLLIPIPCPHCGESFEMSLTWIKSNRRHWCPRCHVDVSLDDDNFRDGVRKIEKAVAELRRAILDLEITVKYPE